MKTITARTPIAPPLPAAPRTTDHPMPLGPQATRALATLCRRYRVQPDCVLRSIVENFLADACADDTLAPCVADEARLIRRSGAVPADWWQKTELKTPGFDTEEANGEEAA